MLQQVNNFLRYPGGKRRMLCFLQNHLPSARKIHGHYIEPFVGSGAVFFCLQPSHALLSDVNQELIELYRGIRYAPRRVWQLYSAFGSTKEDYHYVRDRLQCSKLIERAARTLYLNRTCFKGMWRQNQKGEFNVGYGGEARRWVICEEDLVQIAHKLRQAKLITGDFETIVDKSQKGDFLFLDPPYRPGEKEYKNRHYIWQKFSYSDHQRLAEALKRAKQRNVDWAVTTSSHSELTKLFQGSCALDIPRGTGRMPGITTKQSGEVLITSYKTEGGKNL